MLHQVAHLVGVQVHFAYYYSIIFFIMRNTKSCKLLVSDFLDLDHDAIGDMYLNSIYTINGFYI